MNKKIVRIAILVCVFALTGVAAIAHLTTRTQVSQGDIQLLYNEETTLLSLRDHQLQSVQGIVSNAKGDQIAIQAQGIPLTEVLLLIDAAQFTKITVIADDEYRAELVASDIQGERKAYLILEDDWPKLVVFGDLDSKRNVSHVVRIEVE